MITKDKVTEIFCIIDEFDKNLDGELKKNLCLSAHNGSRKCYINRKGKLSESGMITILICYCLRPPLNTKLYHEPMFCPYCLLLF